MNEDQTESGRPGARSAPDARELEALRREAEEQRDACSRVAAELDNFRKRSAREVEAARKFGAERLAQAILPVRDSLEAGLGRGREGGPSGIARRAASHAAAPRRGVQRGAASARSPRTGETVRSEQARGAEPLAGAADVAPNTVIEVVQKGYRAQRAAAARRQGHRREGRGLNWRAAAPSRGVSFLIFMILEQPHG